MSGISKILAARAVADIEQGIILATADIEAPPGNVFHAITSVSEIKTWWGPPDIYRVTNLIFELVIGGRYNAGVQLADGKIYPAIGRILEINAPYKVAHTRRYDRDFPGLGQRETKVTYLLDPIAEFARVTVRHEGFVGCNSAAYQHAEGWERVLGWLQDYFHAAALRNVPARQ